MKGTQEPKISANTLRQRRYRERHKALPSVTESVTSGVTEALRALRNASVEDIEENGVTGVTRNAPSLSYLESSKERKKERGIQGVTRNALPDDWTPSLEALSLATARRVNVVDLAAKFRLTLKAEGKIYADYDAAFLKWVYSERPSDGESNVYVEPQRNYKPTDAEFNRAAANFAKNNSFWGKAMGPEPGMFGCKCPPEILKKHGIDPLTGLTSNTNHAT